MLETAIVLLLVVLAAPLGCQKASDEANPAPSLATQAAEPVSPMPDQASQAPEQEAGAPGDRRALPRLVDLGAGRCIPCKMMAPILAELKQEYQGVFDVEFIDVWEDPAPARQYGIQLIPTQIFFDASGKELFRHEGYFGKEEILSKWKELGIEVDKKDT